MFEHILTLVSNPTRLKATSAEKIEILRKRFPSISEDYLTFLREVGWGNIGGMMIYSGPSVPEDIYPSITPESAKIVIFGDDWLGSCFGFDLNNRCSLVRVDEDGEVEAVEGGFRDFISGYAR